MKKLWETEPALIVGFFQSALALVVTFGAKLSAEQIGAILATLSALLAVLVRSQMTPKARGKSTLPKAEEKKEEPAAGGGP